MPLITLGDSTKLIIKLPSKGDTGWADDFKNEFALKLVEHDHSGNGLGKRVNVLNLDKVQQGVTPGDGNALIWDSTDEEFKFLNPATTVNPTAFSLISANNGTTSALTTASAAIIPPSTSSIPIQTNISAGVTGWFTTTGKYKFATDGIFRLSASVLVSSSRDQTDINIIAKKISGVVTSNVKTITEKVKSDTPVGSIIAWSASASPGTDWLRCDGSEVVISSYPDLEAVIGSTYATMDGAATPASGNFRVPKHDGKFLRDVGSDTLSDVEADATAANGLSVSEDFSISHTLGTDTHGGHNHGQNGVNFTYAGGSNTQMSIKNSGANGVNTDSAGSHSHSITGSISINGGITGVNGDAETRPENTKVAYYIKAKNSVEKQIVLTALVQVTANDELYIAAKASHATGVAVRFNDADTAGLTLELEKLE